MRQLVAITFLATVLLVEAQNAELPVKSRTLPVVTVSKKELEAYEKDESVKPKLDFQPTGKNPQPASAGVTNVDIAPLIVGGSPSVQKQFPWQIYLIVDNAWLCGGSLISDTWVLTAGHCVYGGRTFVVTVGGIDRTTVETGEVTKTSTTATLHENYDDVWLVNDLAVIQMPSAFTLNDYINVVKLPKLSDTNTYAGSTVIASGYGMTANKGPASLYMNYAQLLIITNAECAAVFGTRTVIGSCICTSADRNKQICSGDSGGPLVVKDAQSVYRQIGIVSFGAARTCTRYPAGFARVTSFLGWISTKTGIAIDP